MNLTLIGAVFAANIVAITGAIALDFEPSRLPGRQRDFRADQVGWVRHVE